MGTRIWDLGEVMKVKDHPHAYGDKQRKSVDMKIKHRIIPTRMGTSLFQSNTLTEDKDHPHAYGDKYLYHFYGKGMLGSSPRVWGQANYLFIGAVKGGIIPTRMGTRV